MPAWKWRLGRIYVSYIISGRKHFWVIDPVTKFVEFVKESKSIRRFVRLQILYSRENSLCIRASWQRVEKSCSVDPQASLFRNPDSQGRMHFPNNVTVRVCNCSVRTHKLTFGSTVSALSEISSCKRESGEERVAVKFLFQHSSYQPVASSSGSASALSIHQSLQTEQCG